MQMTQPRHKSHWSLRTLKAAALGMFGLIYTCLFGEVFLRVMDPQLRMPRFITGTDYGVRGNIPNATYRHVTPEVDIEVAINAQGMRSDQNFNFEKPPGTCRIALLGDSYFMGYEAHYKDTLGHLVGHRLRAQGYAVEVLNFAVSGFSTEEMLRTFDARAIRFDPDIVITQFGADDFGDNMRPQLYQLDETGTTQPTNAVYLPGVEMRDFLMQFGFYRMLIHDSHLYSGFREWAGHTVKNLLTAIGNLRNQLARQETSDSKAAAEDFDFRSFQTSYTTALLELSRKRVEEENMHWFMFEIPTPLYKEYISSTAELTLTPETAQKVISPISNFDTHPRDQLWLYREKGHAHFSETGHDLATRAIIDKLLEDASDVFSRCLS